MGIVKIEDRFLLSGSPERLFFYHDGLLSTRPIAGTKKRGENFDHDELILLELKDCPKENAEHAMLVGLLRNDLNVVAKSGTVQVTESKTVEFYSHVMHLVSEVRGETSASLRK